MATVYTGINYFPLNTGFYQQEIIELLEAMLGVKGPYAVIMLLCKIYNSGYFIPWGEEQSLIFARKLGAEYSKGEMDTIITLLVEKEFFDKKNYVENHILTSVEIQRVWLEATSRRKRDLAALPYLLIDVLSKQNESSKPENALILSTQLESNAENALIFRQSKEKQSKELPPSIPPEGTMERKMEGVVLPPPPPEYAFHRETHNYEGLLETLKRLKVHDPKELKSILQLTDYGRKGTPFWHLANTIRWEKIKEPGKYIIKVLLAPK